MMGTGGAATPDDDPRLGPHPARGSEWERDIRPLVAKTRSGQDLWLIIGGAVLLGVLVLIFLATHRAGSASSATPAPDAVAAPPAPPPADVVAFEAGSRDAAPLIRSNPPVVLTGSQRSAATPAAFPALISDPGPSANLKAPAMVVDLAEAAAPQGSSGAAPGSAASGVGAKKPAGASGAPAPNPLNGDEQFAERVGAAEPERAQATVLRDLTHTIAQGSMIPGVLETALDSDLPGYARAVVSREVRGFDGTKVLIPRGSRVIGQYKSAVAQGQSRAFVIWTRILRPDGASIQIGSSGTDPLGRAGLAGSVNRHFLEQFGGAILLSVVDAGVSSLVRQPSTQVVIGSAQQATSLAGSSFAPTSIPPTVKVAQGAPIRIFVARDLDFSSAADIAP